MTPAISCPGIIGSFDGDPKTLNSPSIMWRFEWHTPHALILIRTSLGLTVGSSDRGVLQRAFFYRRVFFEVPALSIESTGTLV